MLPEAIGTHSVGKVSLTVFMDVRFHLVPGVVLGSDPLAVGADWQNPTEDLDLIQGGDQFSVRLIQRPN